VVKGGVAGVTHPTSCKTLQTPATSHLTLLKRAAAQPPIETDAGLGGGECRIFFCSVLTANATCSTDHCFAP